MQTRQHAPPPARQPPPPPPPPPPRRSSRLRPQEGEETQQQQQQRLGGTLVSPRGQGAGRDEVGWEEVQHPPEREVAEGQEREPLLRTADNPPPEPHVARADQGIQTDEHAAGAIEGERQNSGEEERVQREESAQTTPLAATGWILRVRVPIAPPPPPTRHRRGPHDNTATTAAAAAAAASETTGRRHHPRTGPVVGIHITPHMTVETLSACILQALLHHPLTAPDERQTLFFDRRDHLLVGLFCESNSMFVSLEHLLTTTNPSERMEVYSPNLPPPPPPLPPPVVPWWYHLHNWLIVLVPPLCGSFLYIYWNETCSFLLQSVQWWYNQVVHTPLAELYRYGPWFLGWEGDSLPSICSRITYHGDSAFWYRNLEECERIYAAKEEAWLRLVRPFVWGVWMLLVVLVARFLVWELYFMPHAPPPPPPPVDRDMVDLYRAWQVMLRQVQRGQNYPTSNQQQQQQRTSNRRNTTNYSQQPSARTRGSTGHY